MEPFVRRSFRSLFVDRSGVRLWAIVAGGILALYTFVFGGVSAASAVECWRSVDNLQADGHYDLWAATCYVELDDGTSIPLDNYRAVGGAAYDPVHDAGLAGLADVAATDPIGLTRAVFGL